MRPIELRIEGFTCFKQAQVVRLDDLDLFAISGPTGSGKSSLLDAMVYALYGCIPRIGKRNHTEFISLGSARMSVQFDFRIGGKRYRVVRAARRKGQSTAQMEEVSETGETLSALADRVTDVNDRVLEVIGLDYDGFLQAVVLPQGEFSRFLKGAPGQRQQLLRDLLRLNRYEEMRKSAETKAKAAKVEADHVEQRLGEDFGDATAVVADRLSHAVGEAKLRLDKLRVALSSAEAEVREVRRLRERSAELEVKSAAKASLVSRAPEIQQHERRIDAARRATRVVQLIARTRQAHGRATEAAKKVKLSQEAQAIATGEEEKAEAERRRAETAAKRIPELDVQIERLGEVIGLLEPRQRTQQEIRRLEKERDALAQQEKDWGDELVQLQKAADKATKEVDATRTELQRLAYDEKLHEALEGLADNCQALGKLRAVVERLQSDLDDAVKATTIAENDAEVAEKEAEAAAIKLEAANNRNAEMQEKLRAAEQQHAAEHLRRHLKRGESCPVCEQEVLAVPKTRQGAAPLDALRERASAADQAAANAQQHSSEAAASAKESSKAHRDADRRRKKVADSLKSKMDEMDEAARPVLAWGKKANFKFGQVPEQDVRETEAALRKKRAKHREVEDRLDVASKTAAASVRAVEVLQGKRDGAEAKQTDLKERIVEKAREEADYGARIRKVAGNEDPREQRTALQREVRALEDGREQAQQSASDASRKAGEAKAVLTSVEDQARERDAEFEAARTECKDAVSGAGFPTEEAATEAVLADNEIERLEAVVETHGRELDLLGKRISELDGELGGRRVTQQQLESQEAETERLKKLVENSSSQLHSDEQSLIQLRDRVAKADELRAELAEHRAVERVYGELGDELQIQRFQRYLLDENVRDLVAGASERLKALSDRYTLVLHEDHNFNVLDHDNAGEERSADTLSGGETFLTSLALALELSAQVQRAAGALQLESIFIDEGFGTLDQETLDTVAAAIAMLPKGGRMVGIITHIAALTEQMPGRVVVERTDDGSRVRVINGR